MLGTRGDDPRCDRPSDPDSVFDVDERCARVIGAVRYALEVGR